MDGSLGEAVTRFALCELFPGKQFHKTRRPKWLLSMELDGYNEELRLAFEYQGKQHFEYVPLFHHNDEDNFKNQVERDKLKQELCDDNWVCLILVPYWIPLQDIRGFVRKCVEHLSYPFKLGENVLGFEEFLPRALEHYQQSKLSLSEEEIKRVAQEVESCEYKFIEMLDDMISSDRSRRRMRIRCPQGHDINILFDNFFPVREGKPRRECMLCARKRTNGEKGEKARNERLLKFGLEALDPYGDRHQQARWRCVKNKHTFTASWNTIAIRKNAKCLLCMSI